MSIEASVIVAVDPSPPARAAARFAAGFARASAARIRLIHALPPREIEAWCADLADEGAAVSAEQVDDDPTETIARHARDEDVLVVAVALEGEDARALFVPGGIAERALLRASVPLMLARGRARDASPAIRRILLATDFSLASEHALRVAIRWARRLGADIEVFHAIRDPDEASRYSRPRDCASRSGRQRIHALEALRAILSRASSAGVGAVAYLSYGTPAAEIAKHAARSHADLIVLGLREHGVGSELRAGSVAEDVIRAVDCSVLVAPEAAT